MRVFNSMPEQLEILFQRFINKTATEAEKREFFELIRLPDADEALKILAERYPVPGNVLIELPAQASGEIVEAILSVEDEVTAPVHRMHFLSRIRRFRWAAVAAIGGIIAATGWLLLGDRKDEEQHKVAITNVKSPVSNRATIQLANGKVVYLDNAANGELAKMGDVQLIKLANGQVVYSGNATRESYNTLTNPKGSQPIDIGLSDGTHVWLNAGSSVTYPVAFIPGKERIVTMTGEAYFEVVHDERAPFRVKTANQVIEDIGTSFNVNAFPGEAGIKTTLVEGSVKINDAVLKPGQQYLNGNITAGNVEQALAWKNGFFGFDNADIHTVMREIGRWYDIEIKFEDVKEIAPFQGKISRTMSLTQLLKNLEMYGVHFRFDGNVIVVTSPKP
jgi:transmembrane sensor